MTIQAYRPDGTPISVASKEAPRLFAEGQIRFAPGQRVPVASPDGQLGEVDAEELEQALGQGFSFADADAVQQAAARQRELDAAGEQTGRAFAEGALRGLTFGGSDALAGAESPVLRAAAAAPFGDDAMRQALTDEEGFQQGILDRQEQNPIASGGGEAVGAIGSALAIPGGIAGRGASAATRIASTALQGAAEGAVAEIGMTMGRAALEDEELTGEMLVAAGSRGATFGAIAGGGIAGTIEVARPTLRGLSRFMSRERVNRAIDELAVGHLQPTPAQIDRVRGRDIDLQDIGRILIEEDLIHPKIGRDTFVELADSALENRLGPRIGNMLEELDLAAGPGNRVDLGRLRQRMQDIAAEHGGFANGAFRQIRGELDAVLDSPLHRQLDLLESELAREADELDAFAQRMRREAPVEEPTEEIAARLRGDRPLAEVSDTVADQAPDVTQAGRRAGGDIGTDDTLPAGLGDETVEVERAAGRTALDPEELRRQVDAEQLRQFHGRDAAEKIAQAADVQAAARRYRLEADVPAARDLANQMRFADAHALRRAIDKHLFKGRVGNLQEIAPAQAALHDARRAVNAEIQAAMERAGAAAPEGSPLARALAEWKDANRRYQALAWAREVARKSAAREKARELGAGIDFGVSPALAVATGNPGWVIGGWLGGLFKRWSQRSGKAFAAHKGDAIMRALGLRKARETAEGRIRSAARGLVRGVGKAAKRGGALAVQVSSFNDRADAALRLPTDPMVYDEEEVEGLRPSHVADVSMNAAAVVGTTRARQAQALQRRLQGMGAVPTSTPLDRGARPLLSDTEKAAWLRYEQAVREPLKVMRDPKRMTPEHAEAIRDVYPRVYQALLEQVTTELAEGDPPPYQARVRIALLFPEITPDRTLRPGFVRRYQEPHRERHGGAQGGAATGAGGMPPQPPNPTPVLDERQMTRAQRLAEV